MELFFKRETIVDASFVKRSLLLIYSVLFISLINNVSAQNFEKPHSNVSLRKEMVEPFSSQMPTNVYHSRHMQRSNVKIGYQYRNNVSQPEVRRVEIMSGANRYKAVNRVVLNGTQNNGYYTQTPNKGIEQSTGNVHYNSFPTIDSKGEAMNISEEGSVVETGSMQRLPEDWDEPSNPTPVGDILFPMLLLVGAYLSIRLFKGFNN